jgi:ABC-type uncharacterized transport system permease subunit
VLLAFVALPLGLMLGAFAWQTLPVQVAIRFGGLPKLGFMFAMIGLAGLVAYRLGPVFEDLLFYGDFKAWANGDVGTGADGLNAIAAWIESLRDGRAVQTVRFGNRQGPETKQIP